MVISLSKLLIIVKILVTILILVKTLYQDQYRMTFIDEVMQCESNVILNNSTMFTNIIQSNNHIIISTRTHNTTNVVKYA